MTPRLQQFQQRDLRLLPWRYVLFAILLGFLVPHINRTALPWLVSPLSHDVVIAFLSAASTGMMALTGIVFSLGGIFITFSSSGYTPRLVAAFADSTFLHAIGIFTGAFIYMLIALRAVGLRDNAPVSALTIWVALAWLLASIAMLVRMILRSWMMTMSVVLDILGNAGQRAIRRAYPTRRASTSAPENTFAPPPVFDPTPAQAMLYHGSPRYIRAYDVPSLVALAQRHGAVVRLPHSIGDALIEGDTLAMVYGPHPVPERHLRHAMQCGHDRSVETDPLYAMRLLVDIAIRALSPAVNDPTTAVESLNHLEALLRQLGMADLDIGQVRDAEGALRLVYAVPTWDEYLALGVLEIMHYGAESVQVQRRMGMLLQSLHDTMPAVRHAAVARLATDRLTTVHRVLPDAVERATAGGADRQGLGHTWVE